MVTSPFLSLLTLTVLASTCSVSALPGGDDVSARDIPPIRRPSIPLLHNRAYHARRTSPDLAVRQAWLRDEARNLKRRYVKYLPDQDRALVERDSEHLYKRQQKGQVQIADVGYDASYVGQLSIGTPGQNFYVTLDTGSADLWVADSSCPLSDCRNVPLFSSSQSSTLTNLNTDFNITYGSGAASGTLAQDTVTMAGYTVPDQRFGAVNQVTQGLLTQPYSGLIGLAFQTIASSGAMPFWQQLAVTNQLPEPLMAFFLRRYRDDFSASAIEYDGGEFSLGYTNSSLYVGDINYISIPTQNEDYWRIAVQGLNLETQAVSITSATGNAPQAAIDTGTTLIGVPSSTASAVYAQISGSRPLPLEGYEGYFEYPCNQVINSSLQFGGLSYSISNGDFNLGQFTNDNSMCTGAFFAQDLNVRSPIQWIVGATFLKNVYSVFRYNPSGIGFAALASSANGGSTITSGTATLGTASPTGTGGTGPSSSAALANVQLGTAGLLVTGLAVLATITSTFVIA